MRQRKLKEGKRRKEGVAALLLFFFARAQQKRNSPYVGYGWESDWL